MRYDKYLARANRDRVRFFFLLRGTPRTSPIEPLVIVKPSAFIRAFVRGNPQARRFRKQLLDEVRGRLFIFTERQGLERMRIAQKAYPPA